MTPPSTDYHTEEDLFKTLLSKANFYDHFNKEQGHCDSGSDSWPEKIKMALSKYQQVQNEAEKIGKAFCYVSTRENSEPLYKERCNFLYYWILEILLQKLNNNSSSTAINAIFGFMEELNTEQNNCLTIEDSMDKDTVLPRKTIFDYYHDRTIVQALVTAASSDCEKNYGPYLQGIITAYAAVEKGCTKNKGGYGDYCSKFWDQHKDKIKEDLLKLKCGSMNMQQLISEAQAQALSASSVFAGVAVEGQEEETAVIDVTNGSTNTTTIISSLLPAVGLPTLAVFFLYKVSIIKIIIITTIIITTMYTYI
ncbi:Variable surface protein Vir7-like protein [Plasmodium coatneyi]|uniref:Variable surface protein Vir7-like protein n=1 Tax=Plasmodium coatneyi TaxID=208452 RepID=A0A1B1E255_9APIC|nr:Variable surface protein Vir7-like protein [Plasmodium coatneyi]ANQ09132.1 Variable surface protein Vir7-like protein [Plasmodium coatneyi]